MAVATKEMILDYGSEIGGARNRLLQGFEKTGIASSGEFSKKLQELEDCGFIRKYIPAGYKERNAIFQLIDNYTLFYLRFLKINS